MELNPSNTRWQYIEAMADSITQMARAHKLNRERLEKKLGGKVEQLLPKLESEPKTISVKEV